jgi:uncharacterized repeat protein (TIGR03943 family)
VACGALLFFIFFIRQTLSFRRHSPHRGASRQWPALLLLCLPLLFFLQIPGARFSNDTFQMRRLSPTSLNAPDYSMDPAVPTPGTDESAAADPAGEVSLLQLYSKQENYLDTEIAVRCQTFVDSRLPENTVMCYRYLITCCAADARPLFIFLQHPKGLAIENDAWISTRGKMTLIKNDKLSIPALKIEDVLYVDEPAFPFLY